jgi:hypothetical protein
MVARPNPTPFKVYSLQLTTVTAVIIMAINVVISTVAVTIITIVTAIFVAAAVVTEELIT